MWSKKKLVKILRYYSLLSIVMCLFFAMTANEYFPPLEDITNSTIKYLEKQKNIVEKKDKKEELSRLITYQKIILRNDEYTSNLKFNVMTSSILLLLISIILYIVSTRQLKLNANKMQ